MASRRADATTAEQKMVPTVGFELTTYRLQGGCSTPELCGQESKIQKLPAEFPILRPRKRPKMLGKDGAVERNRTSDLLITNQLLYQLSYNSLHYKNFIALLLPSRELRNRVTK